MEASVANRETGEARPRPSRFALSPLNQRRCQAAKSMNCTANGESGDA